MAKEELIWPDASKGTPPKREAGPPREEKKSAYQGRMHLLQKEMIGRYYERLTAAAEGKGDKAVYMMISGNPVELIQAFDLLPVYPEVNALQLAVKKQCLPFILQAEEMGYSIDNCAYVKADVGMYFVCRNSPFATTWAATCTCNGLSTWQSIRARPSTTWTSPFPALPPAYRPPRTS